MVLGGQLLHQVLSLNVPDLHGQRERGGKGERRERERGGRERGGGRDCYSIRLSSDIFKFYIVTITTTTTTVLVLSLLASPPLSGSPMYIYIHVRTCTYLNALE